MNHAGDVLQDHVRTERRNIQYLTNELLDKQRKLEQAQQAVEQVKHNLNQSVQNRVDCERALLDLGLGIPEEEPE